MKSICRHNNFFLPAYRLWAAEGDFSELAGKHAFWKSAQNAFGYGFEEGKQDDSAFPHAHFYLGGCHRGEACRYDAYESS